MSDVGVANRVNDVIAKAKAATGFDDFGGDGWREGLEILVRSAQRESQFNDFGEQSFYSSLVRPLVNRLQVEHWYDLHPEIDEQALEVELLGVGFPRTGSTALSSMLAEDNRFRSLRIWEETCPCPPPGLFPDQDQARVDAARATVERSHGALAARLRSMLPRSPTGPMEDHDIMAMEFKAQYFLVYAHIPSYADWFANCDMEPTYRYEARVLKLLQWKTPEKRWRLKSPTHTMFLTDHEKVFPGARFVQTHRDISKVLPSVSDLYSTMLRAGNPHTDPRSVGALNLEQWSIALDRMLQFRQDPARDAKFFDIGFSEFQSDPMTEIGHLYDWLGDELDDEAAARMRDWRGANPKDAHGKHQCDAEEFGLSDETLSRRFAAYSERFRPFLD